jgi:hypothetical protein
MSQTHPEGADRRRHPRFDLFAQVRVKRGHIDVIMELVNISASGAFLHMGRLQRPSWLSMRRKLEIAIVHPVDYGSVEVVGRVVRVEEDAAGLGVAVDFVDLESSAREGIERLVVTARQTDEQRPDPHSSPSSVGSGNGRGKGPPPLPRS